MRRDERAEKRRHRDERLQRRRDERDRHAELVRWAMHEVNWNPDDFDVYRFKLQYPPLPSGVAFDFQRRKSGKGAK